MSLSRRFLALTVLRWLPVGLVIPVLTLLPLARGLSLAEVGVALSVQGFVVLLLELPSGGLADALGRRPVLVAAGVLSLLSYVLVLLAQDVRGFAAAYALMGASRALDSGPLSAWFVDESGPAATSGIAAALGRAATMTGAAVGSGALLSGAVLAWAPLDRSDVLALPYLVGAVLVGVQVVATVLLMRETRPHRVGLGAALRGTGPAVLDAVRVLRGSRVLRALVAVELLWGFGMVSFESYTPVRLAEVLGDGSDAAALMGPVTAAAWGCSAVGALAVPWLVRRWSPTSVSVALRLVQGATVVAIGLAGGPVALVAAFLATYAVHVAAGAIYEALLHEQAGPGNRASVLSLASMAGQPGGSLGALALGAVAATWSTSTAFAVAGVVTALAAPLFLVRPHHAEESLPAR